MKKLAFLLILASFITYGQEALQVTEMVELEIPEWFRWPKSHPANGTLMA